MWWNFFARTTEEILAAGEDWEAGRRCGEVRAYDGPRLGAPPFVTCRHGRLSFANLNGRGGLSDLVAFPVPGRHRLAAVHPENHDDVKDR